MYPIISFSNCFDGSEGERQDKRYIDELFVPDQSDGGSAGSVHGRAH